MLFCILSFWNIFSNSFTWKKKRFTFIEYKDRFHYLGTYYWHLRIWSLWVFLRKLHSLIHSCSYPNAIIIDTTRKRSNLLLLNPSTSAFPHQDISFRSTPYFCLQEKQYLEEAMTKKKKKKNVSLKMYHYFCKKS